MTLHDSDWCNYGYFHTFNKCYLYKVIITKDHILWGLYLAFFFT